MRVISWNIMQGGGKRADGIISQLWKWNPDIVGLSEVRGTEPSQRISAALHDMGLVHQVTTVNPIAPVRYGLLLALCIPFRQHAAEGPLHDVQRWIHVELTLPIQLHVMLMHIPNRDEGSEYDCHDWVVQHFDQNRDTLAIAMGDTNTGAAGIDDESPYFNERETTWFERIAEAQWQDVWRRRKTHELFVDQFQRFMVTSHSECS